MTNFVEPLPESNYYPITKDPFIGMELMYIGDGLEAEDDPLDPCEYTKGQKYILTEFFWSEMDDELYVSVEDDRDPVWNSRRFIPYPTIH